MLLLTLTHPRRITAIQLRMVSALSSLADTADTMYPMPEIGCHRKVLLLQSWLFNLYCLVEGAGGDIHCGFTPCISDLKTQEPPASGKLLKALAKLY